MPQQVLVITGPTATGKSALGIEAARRFNGEIINSDSVQVYRDFDIGSGKPETSQLREVPHHLFSCISPDQPFDAFQFTELAHQTIADLHRRKKLPIIVGGTGLYIRSLLCGLIESAAGNPATSPELEKLEADLSLQAATESEFRELYHRLLQRKDPLAAAQIQPSDLVRMRRALAWLLSSGESIEVSRAKHAHQQRRYQALVLCLLPNREALYRRIDQRVEQMFDQGWVGEVEQLRKKYSSDAHPFSAIGYRQVVQHLNGELEELEMHERIKQATRQFAKRQYTWWNNQPEKLGWQSIPPFDTPPFDKAPFDKAQGNPVDKAPGNPRQSWGIGEEIAATITRFRENLLVVEPQGIALTAVRG